MLASGCGAASSERPTTCGWMPSWEEATEALQSVLTAWRDAPDPLPASFDLPAVQFVDQHRRPGQRLLSFQILGRLDLENARQFTVQLTLQNEEAPQLVRYNCVGRQPVFVFRLEDYELISHWEHKMDDPADAAKDGSKDGAKPTPPPSG